MKVNEIIVGLKKVNPEITENIELLKILHKVKLKENARIEHRRFNPMVLPR